MSDPTIDSYIDVLERLANETAETHRRAAMFDDLVAGLKATVDHIDRETCRHEETSRIDSAWTICDWCEKKWMDFQGGFVPFKENQIVTNARELIARAPEGTTP